MNRSITISLLITRQRGASLVFVTIAMTTLLGFAALAIDMGYLLVVRNELQNAADTGALSGASYLYPLVSNAPNWSVASSKAISAVQLNKAGNAALITAVIQTGYWNLTGNPTGLHANSVDTTNDRPAIKVTVTKSGGNGVIRPFFANVLGFGSFSPSATAVAAGGLSPAYTYKNLFPVALSGCIFGLGAGGTGTATYPAGSFETESIYGSNGSCSTSQWTSLSAEKNQSDSYVGGLISQAGMIGSSKLSIGDLLFIQSGTKANLYGTVDDCSAEGDKTCAYETMAVVCPISGTCDTLLTDGTEKIVAFVCVNILSSTKHGNKSYITMQVVQQNDPNYIKNCEISDSGGIGPSYGVTMPPKLVNYSGNSY